VIKETQIDLPIFSTYPGLLKAAPHVRMLEGKWVIEWRWQGDNDEVTLVLHAFVTAQPMWSYAIYDRSTNTVRQYVGRHADIDQDRLMKIEEGRPPT